MKLPDKIDIGGKTHTARFDAKWRYIALWYGRPSRQRFIEIWCSSRAQYKAMVALLAKEAKK